jgi:hypothetical protein
VVADRAPLLQIGAEQALLERVLFSALARQMQESVRVERVARLDVLEVERQAVRGGDADHALDHVLGLRDAAAVLAGEPLRVRLLVSDRRGSRIELERAPGHDDLVPVGKLGEGRLEPALADVAPWARDVGPDLNLESFGHLTDSGAIRADGKGPALACASMSDKARAPTAAVGSRPPGRRVPYAEALRLAAISCSAAPAPIGAQVGVGTLALRRPPNGVSGNEGRRERVVGETWGAHMANGTARLRLQLFRFSASARVSQSA